MTEERTAGTSEERDGERFPVGAHHCPNCGHPNFEHDARGCGHDSFLDGACPCSWKFSRGQATS